MIWRDKEVLHLVLMRDPFERIMNGTKPIEYRDNTPYWYKRLNNKDIKNLENKILKSGLSISKFEPKA